MHILLTNDDGIFAPGLRALGEAFAAAGHAVYVCAPDRERSAASHSATFSRPLHAEPVDFPCAQAAWAADGTPDEAVARFMPRGRRTRSQSSRSSSFKRGVGRSF